MSINVRQEGHDYTDNKWFIEVTEKWYVFDIEEEGALTNFLRQNQIPYSINYCFEGIIFDLHTKGGPISDFKRMKTLLNDLLDHKNKFVNPKPDINDLMAKADKTLQTHQAGAFLGNPDMAKPKITLSEAQKYGLMPNENPEIHEPDDEYGGEDYEIGGDNDYPLETEFEESTKTDDEEYPEAPIDSPIKPRPKPRGRPKKNE